MKRAIGAVAFLCFASSVACNARESTGCSKDTDCKGERVCNAGSCVSPRSLPDTSKPTIVDAQIPEAAKPDTSTPLMDATTHQLSDGRPRSTKSSTNSAATANGLDMATVTGFLDAMKNAMDKIADEVCSCTTVDCVKTLVSTAKTRGSDAGYRYTRGKEQTKELSTLLARVNAGSADELVALMKQHYGSWFDDFAARTESCTRNIIDANK